MSSRLDPIAIQNRLTATADHCAIVRLELENLKAMKGIATPNDLALRDERIQFLEVYLQIQGHKIVCLQEQLRLIGEIQNKRGRMFKIYRRKDNRLMEVFPARSDAVFWCKVNQISSLPDGEWEDDYYILEMD